MTLEIGVAHESKSSANRSRYATVPFWSRKSLCVLPLEVRSAKFVGPLRAARHTPVNEDFQPTLSVAGSPRSTIHPEAIAAVGGIIARLSDSHGDEIRAQLRCPLSRLATQFRASGQEVTTLVVEIKEAWFTLPEVDRLPRRDGQAILDVVVTILIEEYFGPAPRTT